MEKIGSYEKRGSNNLSIFNDSKHKELCFQVKNDFCMAPLNKRLVKKLVADLEKWLEEAEHE